MTVKSIVEKIAGDNGLPATVDASLGAIFIDHIDQQNESDMAFLSRLAKRVGATFKLGGGNVVFAAQGSSIAPFGKAKTPIIITPGDVSSLSATCDRRGDYKSATASYRDRATGKQKTVSAGSGGHTHRDRGLYGSEGEAQAAAAANLGRVTRGQTEVTIDGPGNPALFAEAIVVPTGFDPDVDGRYLAKSVTHTFSGRGYRTRVTLEIMGAG